MKNSKKSFGSKLNMTQNSYNFMITFIEITTFSIISSLVICCFFLLAENQIDRRKASQWVAKYYPRKGFGHPVHCCWLPKITPLILAYNLASNVSYNHPWWKFPYRSFSHRTVCLSVFQFLLSEQNNGNRVCKLSE